MPTQSPRRLFLGRSPDLIGICLGPVAQPWQTASTMRTHNTARIINMYIRAVASQSQVICIHALHDEHNDIPKRSSGGRGPLQRKEALHFET